MKLMNKILLTCCLCLPMWVIGQQLENAPYSKFGLGTLTPASSMGYRSMAGTSLGMVDRFNLNINNPASYAFLGATAFEAAAYAKKSRLKEGNLKTSSWNGNLDYIGLGFPLKNPINEAYETKKQKYKLGMAFALSNYSRISYNITSQDSTADIGAYGRKYTGEGGFYKLQWGNAIALKDFSFGLNLGYIFGNVKNDNAIAFKQAYAFSNTSVKSYGLTGFSAQAGVMYRKMTNEAAYNSSTQVPANYLNIGFTIAPGLGFSTERDEITLSRQQVQATELIDTITQLKNKAGKGNFPAEFGLGIAYQKGEKMGIGLDINYSTWSNYFNEANGDRTGELRDALSISIGGYTRPNAKTFATLLQRALYKYGVYYKQDQRVVLDKNVNTMGLTLGTTLPFVFQRKIAHANIGLDLGQTGKNTAISESYFKINFGFTFNDDEWFIRRKYN
jgi:hypothetical protein